MSILGIFGFKDEFAFLSNFYPVQIEYLGVKYSSTEHAYQAQKCLDVLYQSKVRDCETPGQAKRLGAIANIRHDWDSIKFSIMLELIRIKFKDPVLRQMLLDTGDCHIEETNRWGDTYWGVCNGVGKNMLGQILMQVRQEIYDDRFN